MRIRTFSLAAVAILSWLLTTSETQAQPPGGFINLGDITDTVLDYNVPDVQTTVTIGTGGQIVWYRFSISQATTASGPFVDIRTSATSAVSFDSEIGVYDAAGNRIADDDDDGHSLRSALSFGTTTPARTAPADPFGFTNGVAFNGRDGNLPAGEYFIAVSQFDAVFGATGFGVTTDGTGTGSWTLEFRTSIAAVPEPTTLALVGATVMTAGLGIQRWNSNRKTRTHRKR